MGPKRTRFVHIKTERLRDKAVRKDRTLRHRYGIGLKEYNKMLFDQNGKCKLCLKKKRLVVEHNHENGKIRGLTCDRCNQLLGYLELIEMDMMFRVHDYLRLEGDIDF